MPAQFYNICCQIHISFRYGNPAQPSLAIKGLPIQSAFFPGMNLGKLTYKERSLSVNTSVVTEGRPHIEVAIVCAINLNQNSQ